VIPTLHARVGDTVYVHGSAASRIAPRARKRGSASASRSRSSTGSCLRARSSTTRSTTRSGRPPRDGTSSSVTTRSSRRCTRSTEQLAPGPLGRRSAADRQGAEGDLDPGASDRGGFGQRYGAGRPEDDPEGRETSPCGPGVVSGAPRRRAEPRTTGAAYTRAASERHDGRVSVRPPRGVCAFRDPRRHGAREHNAVFLPRPISSRLGSRGSATPTPSPSRT